MSKAIAEDFFDKAYSSILSWQVSEFSCAPVHCYSKAHPPDVTDEYSINLGLFIEDKGLKAKAIQYFYGSEMAVHSVCYQSHDTLLFVLHRSDKIVHSADIITSNAAHLKEFIAL